jgi:hypothetical protein
MSDNSYAPGTLSAEKNSLIEKIAKTIQYGGFDNAWETHIKEIVALYQSQGAAGKITSEDLYSLMKNSPALKSHFESLPLAAIKEIEDSFLPENKIDEWDSISHKEFFGTLHQLYAKNISTFDQIKEGDGSSVKVLENEVFKNWGRTIENIPQYTFFPKSVMAVQNIVIWAKANKKKVRVAGYRHTWGDLYSADGQILVSTLSLDVATHLPASHPPIDPNNNLEGIKIIGEIQVQGVAKGLCRIGAATTNEQFRQWATGENGNVPGGWTVPLNVIMVEITWGGSNAPICHGAGLRHQTLSDLVYEIEYVDPNGILRTINDPKLLRAASGCFGLLGVVTAVTLKLDKMSYANMRPYKERIGLAIPPPKGFIIPKGVDMSGITPQQEEASFLKFVETVEKDYYSEFFWFAFQKDCWINCWQNDGRKEDSQAYPSKADTIIQEAEEYTAELLTESALFKWLPPAAQAKLITTPAMFFLPDIKESDPSIVTPVIDGLHFRRGIQNFRVYDMEWEIPIPARTDDPSKPDWSICQKAWWAVIEIFYNRYNSNSKDVPMQLTMEMRIMGDSDIIMAPQFGNKFGTCSIEVLTILTTPKEAWKDFQQEISSAWDSYKDSSGDPLNIRPHWAKEWAGIKIRGMDVTDYLKNIAYKDQLPEFKNVLTAIAKSQGFTLSDMQERFSNPLIDNIFESLFKP